MKLYVDGILDNYSFHDVEIYYRGDLYFGANDYADLFKLHGIVDEVVMFEKALDENEVYDFYLIQRNLFKN